MKILGAVIAGGQSIRFGSDKADARLAGRRLIDHAIDGLARQTGQIVICGRYEPDYPCLADRPAPGLGPLGGLAAALHFATGLGFTGVLTSACDTPLVPGDLAQRLVGEEPAIVAGQPLFGYWHASLTGALDSFLLDPANRAVGKWASFACARRVQYSSELPNINTVAALDELHRERLPCA